MGVHLDENAFCSVYVNLEQASLVERGVEQREEALGEGGCENFS